jgi:hypothetical protein
MRPDKGSQHHFDQIGRCMGDRWFNGLAHSPSERARSGCKESSSHARSPFSPEGGLIGLLLRVSTQAAPSFSRVAWVILDCSRRTRPFQSSSPLFKGVVKVALYCAHRATTVSSWGLCEQEGHLATPFPSFLQIIPCGHYKPELASNARNCLTIKRDGEFHLAAF